MELKEWLGHAKVDSVLAYAKADRKKLSRAYASAEYFKQNVRRMEVLLDVDAIESGRAAQGASYKYYDLGHGYCTYNFFSECPHRMACVKCSFYLPSGSDAARLLEARNSNQRLLEEITLREDEIAAASGDAAAIAELARKLELLPSPDAVGEAS